MDLNYLMQQLTIAATQYGGKILLAVFSLIVGLWIIGRVTKFLANSMSSKHVDKDVLPFLTSMISVLLKVLLLLSIAGILGIQTTSFVAILGAAGLAVGLALQGSLANFAGGLLMLIFKPFRVGDLVTAQGFTGNIKEIQIFNTIMVTPDNKTIILPNGPLSTSPITNNSSIGTIRVDMQFAASGLNTVDAIKSALQKVVSANPYALKDTTHDILVNKLTENAIVWDVRIWTKPETYWETYYFTQENVKRQFDQDKIVGPQINLNLFQKA